MMAGDMDTTSRKQGNITPPRATAGTEIHTGVRLITIGLMFMRRRLSTPIPFITARPDLRSCFR